MLSLSQLKLKTHRLLLTSLFPLLCCCSLIPQPSQTTHTQTQPSVHIYTQKTNQPLILLFDNDHHGHILENHQGEYGLAARKTLVDRRRAKALSEDIPTLYLSGGDVNTGPAFSTALKAKPDFDAMNLLGVDAMVLGNHEFDNPLPVLLEQRAWANFPFLSANIFDKKTGERIFQSHAFFEKAGLKIAVFGLTTMDTLHMVKPGHLQGVEFRDPIAIAKTLVPELKKQADIVIALTHLGHFPDENHGINSPGDVTLARQVSDIDIIVGGHTQTAVCMLGNNQINADFQAGDPCMPDVQNDTIIVQANEWGKYLGELHVNFNRETGKVSLLQNQLIPINMQRTDNGKTRLGGDSIPNDPQMQALLDQYAQEVNQLMNQPLATLDANLSGDRDILRNQQSPLGQIFVESLIQATQADVGIFNGGGLREGLQKGTITFKDIFTIHPFGNELSYVDLTGEELTRYMEVLATQQFLTGGFPHLRGVEFALNNGKISHLKVLGQKPREVKPKETYRLVFNDFLAGGGDAYPYLLGHPKYVQTTTTCIDVVKDYLKSVKQIKVADYTPHRHLRS